ncbi:MAG: glycosyltransferase [Candidatus Jordarchaeales archaeon]
MKFVLNSVLAQKENDSFKIGEILVVSDGSIDATPDIVREYCAFDSRIRLYHYDVRKGKVMRLT